MGLNRSYHDWQESRRLAQEIDSLPDSEILAFGLTRAEFREVAAMRPEQVARMEAMAGLLGAAAALESDPALRAAAALECARCGETRACRSELQRVGGARADQVDFCPNAGLYRGLAAPEG